MEKSNRKSRSFPKLDRKSGIVGAALSNQDKSRSRTGRAAIIPGDKETWIAWRMKLGAGRKEAGRLWLQYQEWRAQEAQNPRARIFAVKPWQNWEREFRAFLDEMPRKPHSFLARVAAAERRRAEQAVIAARKANGRERYERQYARRR